jgi:UDP-glucuronate 4-epimerase
MKRVLLTGCAGFIGFHVTQRLLQSGHEVIGIDNLNRFYNEGLKPARLEILRHDPGFKFIHADIADLNAVTDIFQNEEFTLVVHLAAQAGVRYSLENPHLYVQSNLAGFVNVIEESRKKKLEHFVFASSSSVYGANKKTPFSETDNVDHPISLYAATKKSNELIAHVYAHLYGLPVTGLRFFTVYGPWGRPDMAIFKFCKAIHEDSPIEVYNQGQMHRDFTYIDDIVEGIVRVLAKPPSAGHVLENTIGKKANIKWLPMQPGDVPVTYADIDRLGEEVGYRPQTSIEEGVSRFVDWYREFYNLHSLAAAAVPSFSR